MKGFLFLITLFAFALPANSAGFSVGVDQRSDAVTAQLQGNNSYHAHLARELSDIAIEEKSQHDIDVAKAFMDMAEEHAAKAGGVK
ncbi:hypothetical protein JYT23_01370 [Mariprofundus ferrooxydans]|nr:hypothetical protein [Mariprofundus ferrooxydans]